MHKRFVRFRELVLPEIISHLGLSNVHCDEHARVIKFWRDEGKKRVLFMQFYPIGNYVVLPGNKWIREFAIDYMLQEVFGEPRMDLRLLAYPVQDPKVKPPKTSAKKVIKKEEVEALVVVGDRFSEENLSKRPTWAADKMEKLLQAEGIPYIKEFPVVVNNSLAHGGKSKLYIIDFYIPPPFNFIIEVDGGYHSTEERMNYDNNRDWSLRGKGLGITVRITNEQVLDVKFSLLDFLKNTIAFKRAIKSYKKSLSLRKF